MVIGAEVTLLGPCGCVWVLCEVTHRLFVNHMVIGAEVTLLGPCCCIGWFVKSSKNMFLSDGHWGRGDLVGALLLYWVLCEVTQRIC